MNIVKQLALAAGLCAALAAAPAPAAQEDAIPRLDRVYLIVMENHAYGQIIGNGDAPFLNQFARSANLATNYFAVGHPSLNNYLELVGGSNFGIVNDNYPDWHGATHSSRLNAPIAGPGMSVATPARFAPFNTEIPAAPYVARTIADQLVAAGKTWKSYQESLPASGGVDGVDFSDGNESNLGDEANVLADKVQKLYAVKHNPFAYFANVQENTTPGNGLANMAGFAGKNGLYADLNAGTTPNFSLVVPNQCHDMHGIGNGTPECRNDAALIRAGDTAVRQLVEAIKAAPSWKTGSNAIIVVWDENDYSPAPNRVVAIVDTSYGVKGLASAQPYSHFSLLKTLEQGFGLPCLNHACDGNVKTMNDLFGMARKSGK